MIDFKKKLEEEEGVGPEDFTYEKPLKNKRKRFSNFVILIVTISLVFSGKVIMSSPGASSWLEHNSFFNKIKHLSPSIDKTLKGEENDRINILLLGMGGEGHDGAFLTDTIMLSSIKPSSKEVSLISFPRDLVSPVSNWRKINSINAYAEYSEPGSGGEKVMEAMSKLLDIDIDYFIRVDFNGFSKIIDEIGGVDIVVENSFTDNRYPIDGQENNPDYYSRFERLSFKAGKQHMDGKTALKYARSRHALGIEGSDYARARRQQILIQAVKDKLLSSQTLLNPVTLTKLANQFNKNVSTNIEIWEALKLWDMTKGVEKEDVTNFVLNDAPDNYLIASRGEDGAFILVPKSGNFSDIRKLVKNIFPEEEKIITREEIKTISGTSSVAVLNGTWINGLAGRKSALAKQAGFEIFEVANAPKRDYNETIIYDLSGGEKKSALQSLTKLINAKQANYLPDWIEKYKTENTGPDIVLVLGVDADNDY